MNEEMKELIRSVLQLCSNLWCTRAQIPRNPCCVPSFQSDSDILQTPVSPVGLGLLCDHLCLSPTLQAMRETVVFSRPSFIGLNKCFMNKRQKHNPKTQELCKPRPSQFCSSRYLYRCKSSICFPIQRTPHQCSTSAPAT